MLSFRKLGGESKDVSGGVAGSEPIWGIEQRPSPRPSPVGREEKGQAGDGLL